uniref:Uncharacterized protein n=1 Tax=Anguilla anguilla TaxID=7936 RepID=A0A0E9PBK5_ANGAN
MQPEVKKAKKKKRLVKIFKRS